MVAWGLLRHLGLQLPTTRRRERARGRARVPTESIDEIRVVSESGAQPNCDQNSCCHLLLISEHDFSSSKAIQTSDMSSSPGLESRKRKKVATATVAAAAAQHLAQHSISCYCFGFYFSLLRPTRRGGLKVYLIWTSDGIGETRHCEQENTLMLKVS